MSNQYSHPSIAPWEWRTIPQHVPPDLRQRYMLREGMRKSALKTQSVVYYVDMGEESTRAGYIKIGHTTNMRARLSQLKGKYGGEPTVLATEPGDTKREAEMHSRFSHLARVRGGFNEQFEDAPELREWIAQLVTAWGPPMITGPLPDDWPFPE